MQILGIGGGEPERFHEGVKTGGGSKKLEMGKMKKSQPKKSSGMGGEAKVEEEKKSAR